MIVIVEGPDGSGKSTLIEKLGCERIHLRALRGGVGADGEKKEGWGAGRPAVEAYLDQITQAAKSGRRVGFDRFHLSEVIYGPLLRNHQEITPRDLTVLTTKLHALQIPIIMCLPPVEVTFRNVFKEGRHVPHYQTEEFLRQSYGQFAYLTPWATHVYDFTTDPLPVLDFNEDTAITSY